MVYDGTKRHKTGGQTLSGFLALLSKIALFRATPQKNYWNSYKNNKTQTNINYLKEPKTSNITLPHNYNKFANKDSKSNIRILQLNVGEMSRVKAEIIAQVFNDADIIALQETHVPND